MAGFQLSLIGRFWVSPKDLETNTVFTESRHKLIRISDAAFIAAYGRTAFGVIGRRVWDAGVEIPKVIRQQSNRDNAQLADALLLSAYNGFLDLYDPEIQKSQDRMKHARIDLLLVSATPSEHPPLYSFGVAYDKKLKLRKGQRLLYLEDSALVLGSGEAFHKAVLHDRSKGFARVRSDPRVARAFLSPRFAKPFLEAEALDFAKWYIKQASELGGTLAEPISISPKSICLSAREAGPYRR